MTEKENNCERPNKTRGKKPMDQNQSESTREISNVNVLKSLRQFCIVILQHQVLVHITAFKLLS